MQPRGWLEVSGQRLEFEHHGPSPEAAPCLVLLHEGLGCVGMWRDFPAALQAATGWGVFSYSRQGYGQSSPCALPRPLDYMHHEAVVVLPQLLQSMGFREGVLLGHSDGASIAAIHAGTRAHPGLRGLVLMAPHFFTEDMGIAAIRDAREAFQGGRLRQGLARFHGDNVDCAFKGWNDAWLDPGFRAFDIRDCIHRIDVPLCVIQGLQDQYGTRAQVDCAAQRARGPVSTHLLEDCAHAPHRDRPEAVLGLLREFTAGLALSPLA